jgi:hypothetical protein
MSLKYDENEIWFMISWDVYDLWKRYVLKAWIWKQKQDDFIARGMSMYMNEKVNKRLKYWEESPASH